MEHGERSARRDGPAEYKHVALGLVFLKYISDGFKEHRAAFIKEKETDIGVDPDDRDEYLGDNVFWVPDEARWERLQGAARSPKIGEMVDDAMRAVERDNPILRGALVEYYEALDSETRALAPMKKVYWTVRLNDL